MNDAFADGVECFHAGRPESANPFDLDGEEQAHLDWNDGWNAAAECTEEDEELD